MKRLFQKIPYNHRVAIVILLFTLIPCIILGVTSLQTERNEKKEILLSDYYAYIDTTATLASKTISSLESKMDYLRYNYEIHSYFSIINELTLSQTFDLIREMNNAASIIALDNSDVTARWYPLSSTTSYGDYCHPLSVFASEFPAGSADPTYLDILALNNNESLWKSRNLARQPDAPGAFTDRLCLYSSFSTFDRSACILEITLPLNELIVPLEDDLPLGSLFAICLSQNGYYEYITLSSHITPAESSPLLAQYEQTGSVSGYEILKSPISNVEHGNVLLLLPESYVNDLLRPETTESLMLYSLIAVAILCTCYLTSHLLTRKISRAIKEIQRDIAAVAAPPFAEDPVPADIQRICVQVKDLVQTTEEYCRKIDYYEKESIRTELELLQMRFNPHLLYNTLAAVNHQAKEPQAREAIVSLANYYRVVLNNGQLIIRIQDEIEMVKEYLSVMKYTYNLTNISYHFEIDEEILQYSVIKHVLQPIVENAIHHGLRPLSQEGHLCIYGKMEPDCLLIQVTDNGTGMTPEEVDKLLTKPTNNSRGGYGIYNVQSRLQLHYGKEYGLTIDSTVGKGTCVTMRIPKVLE